MGGSDAVPRRRLHVEDAMTLMDNAVYVAGRRTASPSNLDETYALLRERQGMAWIGSSPAGWCTSDPSLG